MSVLPPSLHRLLSPEDAAAAAAVNRSLIFEKSAVPGPKEWKRAFFTKFVEEYRQHEAEYDAFITRRSEAMSWVRALYVDVENTSRLIVGHGLPHTTQIGFLFDRLRGAPYLPGSTVKGLLRETARLVLSGEIVPHSPAAFGVQAIATRADEIFGTQSRRGALVCEDAYAVTWPRLEVDVMTPHHASYYESGTPPGDWESPVPVYFLTIAANQQFRFWLSRNDVDVDAATIESLLKLGLEWLGAGGKKSSGYGRFWPLDDRVIAQDPPKKPTPPADWPDAQLSFTPNDGLVAARWQGKTARAKYQPLPEWFRKKKTATARVTVEGFTIVFIEWPPK